jgi:MFS family permease
MRCRTHLTTQISDKFYHKGTGRPIFFAAACLVMALGQFVLSTATGSAGVAGGVALCAIAFGSTWPLMVITTSELFGSKHLGGNYMVFDGTCSAIGTLALSKFVAEVWYNKNAVKQANGDMDCHGPHCFRQAHVVMALLALTGAAASFVLWRRSQAHYRQHLAMSLGAGKVGGGRD